MSATPPRSARRYQANGCVDFPVARISESRREQLVDQVISETAIALVYNGVPFAVMMATPRDLEDFALGFALSEGIVATPHEFELVDTLKTKRGMTLQGMIPRGRFEALQERRRNLSGRSGCGLCGIEALEDAVPVAPRVISTWHVAGDTIVSGMRLLTEGQSLNAATGGAHAAALIAPGRAAIVREDVGRHNALDKLIGALALTSAYPATNGFLAITSRASWEIVHKAAHAGIAVIAAISAPTSLAIEAADAANITLVAFARGKSMNIYTHAGRID